jgi:subtilisin family serine protease
MLGVAGDPSDGTDPVSADLNAIATARGVLFVAATGDNGPEGKVASPAAADQAVAVVATDKQRTLAPWSARDPRLENGAVKPDLAAPGVEVMAARANPRSAPYEPRTGTATAAAVAAGAAALVMQYQTTNIDMQGKGVFGKREVWGRHQLTACMCT